MLVLSRKVGQKILIGDQIEVTVVRVAQGTVRIGVEAPDNFTIVRQELAVNDVLDEEDKKDEKTTITAPAQQ
ncbi:MAG: carbon storage regulator [Planctomycetia bacterium]|jgi:carbon storage regulator